MSNNIPSLAELFKQKPSNMESSDASSLPSLSELLKSTTSENTRSTPLLNNDISLSLLSSQCGFLPLNEISSTSSNSNSKRGNFTSLNEFSNIPGNFTSLNELSLNEFSKGTGMLLPPNEHSSNKTANFTSLDELSLNEFSKGTGMLLSNEHSSNNTTNIYKPKVANMKHLLEDTTVRQKKNENESSCECSFKGNDYVNDIDGKSSRGNLPTLLNLLTFDNNSSKNNIDNISDERNVRNLYENDAHNLLPISSLTLDVNNFKISPETKLPNESRVKTQTLSLTEPSNFSKVVAARLHNTSHHADRLHKQFKHTHNCSLTEVMVRNIDFFSSDMDEIFSFATASPDDTVLSHQSKAYQRDY